MCMRLISKTHFRIQLKKFYDVLKCFLQNAKFTVCTKIPLIFNRQYFLICKIQIICQIDIISKVIQSRQKHLQNPCTNALQAGCNDYNYVG